MCQRPTRQHDGGEGGTTAGVDRQIIRLAPLGQFVGIDQDALQGRAAGDMVRKVPRGQDFPLGVGAWHQVSVSADL